jgi:hypothetical protein
MIRLIGPRDCSRRRRAPEEHGQGPCRPRKGDRPKRRDPDHPMEINLQGEKREQQSVGDEEEAHEPLLPAASEHPGREEGSQAHEAIAEDIHRVQEGIERREQKRLDARDPAGSEPGRHEGKLDIIVDGDHDRIAGGEGHGRLAPYLFAGGRQLVDGYSEREKREAQEKRGHEENDQAERRTGILRPPLGAQPPQPFRYLSQVIGDAENRGEHGGPESDRLRRRGNLHVHASPPLGIVTPYLANAFQ